VVRAGLELGISSFQVLRPNHSATLPHIHSLITFIRSLTIIITLDGSNKIKTEKQKKTTKLKYILVRQILHFIPQNAPQCPAK